MKRDSLLLLTTLFLFLFLPSCSSNKDSSLKAAGVVEGDVLILRTQVAGTLLSLSFQEGDRIEGDRPLGKLEDLKVKNLLEQVEISRQEVAINRERLLKKRELLLAQKRYLARQEGRLSRLTEGEAASGESWERAALQLKEAETTLYDTERALADLRVQESLLDNKRGALELNLRDHTLRAPVSGLVLEKVASSGENLPAGAPIAEILDEKTLRVEVFLELQEVSLLKIGQSAEIVLDGTEKRIPAKIVLFGQKAEFSPKYIVSEKERQSLLVKVTVRPEGDSSLLKVGAPVTVRFPLS